jgi:hypothetical protein
MTAIVRWALVLAALVGLGFDAYTHLDLASLYSHNTTGTVNEGVLFQIEAALAIVAGLLLVLRQNIVTTAFAVLVSGGGAFVLLLYRYVDVGKIGPIPNMYDPYWAPAEKVISAIGEGLATIAAAALFAVLHRSVAGATKRPDSRAPGPLVSPQRP